MFLTTDDDKGSTMFTELKPIDKKANRGLTAERPLGVTLSIFFFNYYDYSDVNISPPCRPKLFDDLNPRHTI